ncbi:MAG: D-glycero-beta-D-manno-heptose 1,7-bisphosphate 7-phosphatase [Gammaproteobacteria bacterium]|nr:D-glycero-beta-D-manno-heptose 1,7-bisphosphate 7-phosphatase [Gammaproteobacteria bacterium]
MQLVILDRDGVINEDSPNHIRSADEWVPIRGSLEAIARLHQAGVRIVVATNQPGIKRRLFSVESLNAIHGKLHRMVSEIGGHIDAIVFCPHSAKDGCGCRKPEPGMLTSVMERMHINPDSVTFVGDKASDVQAALAAGVHPVLVRSGQGEANLEAARALTDLEVHDDLSAFVDHYLVARGERSATTRRGS